MFSFFGFCFIFYFLKLSARSGFVDNSSMTHEFILTYRTYTVRHFAFLKGSKVVLTALRLGGELPSVESVRSAIIN